VVRGGPTHGANRVRDCPWQVPDRRQRLAERYPALDASRLDWMIALSLARTFTDAEPAELARAMYEGSPGLTERKAGHVADDVTRTVMKALGAAAQERMGR